MSTIISWVVLTVFFFLLMYIVTGKATKRTCLLSLGYAIYYLVFDIWTDYFAEASIVIQLVPVCVLLTIFFLKWIIKYIKFKKEEKILLQKMYEDEHGSWKDEIKSAMKEVAKAELEKMD